MSNTFKLFRGQSLAEIMPMAIVHGENIKRETFYWMMETFEHECTDNRPTPSIEILNAVNEISKNKYFSIKKKAEAVCNMVFGLGLALDKGIPVGEQGRLLGYALTNEDTQQSAYGMAAEAGRVEILLDAVKTTGEDDKAINDFLAEISSKGLLFDNSFTKKDETYQRAPGYLLADHIIHKDPALAIHIDISTLISIIHQRKDIGFDEDIHKEAFGRVFRAGLREWLKSNPEKPFKLHHSCGDKKSTKEFSGAVLSVRKMGLLNDEQMVTLGDAEAMYKFDKALVNSAELWYRDTRKWGHKKEDLDLMRFKIRNMSFEEPGEEGEFVDQRMRA